MSGPVVMKLIGLSSGTPTPFDGEYLKEYDPDRQGVDPHGRPLTGHVVTTPDINRARRFRNAVEAMECWRQQSRTVPMRDDGKPNRPLTAFSAMIEEAPEEAVQ